MNTDLLHDLVNVKQWFEYSRVLTIPFFFFISLLGNYGILIIYFGFPQSLELILGLALVTLILMIVMGYFLLKWLVQPTDITMQQWRNVWVFFLNQAMIQGMLSFCEREAFPLPEYLQDWGLHSWEDLERLNQLIFRKGIKAGMQPIIRRFLTHDNA